MNFSFSFLLWQNFYRRDQERYLGKEISMLSYILFFLLKKSHFEINYRSHGMVINERKWNIRSFKYSFAFFIIYGYIRHITKSQRDHFPVSIAVIMDLNTVQGLFFFSCFIFTAALVVYITAMITHVFTKQANKQTNKRTKKKLKATFVIISDVLILSPYLLFSKYYGDTVLRK